MIIFLSYLKSLLRLFHGISAFLFVTRPPVTLLALGATVDGMLAFGTVLEQSPFVIAFVASRTKALSSGDQNAFNLLAIRLNRIFLRPFFFMLDSREARKAICYLVTYSSTIAPDDL